MFIIPSGAERNLRNLIGVTLTNGLGGEKEGARLRTVCKGTHCDGLCKLKTWEKPKREREREVLRNRVRRGGGGPKGRGEKLVGFELREGTVYTAGTGSASMDVQGEWVPRGYPTE